MMPGLLSGLFDSDGTTQQGSVETTDGTPGSDQAMDDTTADDGDQGDFTPVDMPPPPVGVLGDDPNEGAAG